MNRGIQGRAPEEHMYPLGRNWGSTNQGVVNEVVHNPFLMPLSTSACITQRGAAGGGEVGSPCEQIQGKAGLLKRSC